MAISFCLQFPGSMLAGLVPSDDLGAVGGDFQHPRDMTCCGDAMARVSVVWSAYWPGDLLLESPKYAYLRGVAAWTTTSPRGCS